MFMEASINAARRELIVREDSASREFLHFVHPNQRLPNSPSFSLRNTLRIE